VVHTILGESVHQKRQKPLFHRVPGAHSTPKQCATSLDVGASPPRSAAAKASSLAACAQEEPVQVSHGLGAEIELANGKEKWFPATTERPSTILFELGTRVVWDDSIGCPGIGTVLGFGTHTLTASYLLVQWDDEDSPSWMDCKDLQPSTGNASTNPPPTAPPVVQSPSLVPVQGAGPDAGKSTSGAIVRHDLCGLGPVLGMDGNMVKVQFGAPHGVKSFLPCWLKLIEPAPAVHPMDRDEPVFHVGDTVAHLKYGVMALDGINGDVATCAFPNGQTIDVPLSELTAV
jgi:hypothetical protein